MATVTLTSREFSQHACAAKKAAREGPVFITDRGRAAYVLLAIEDYRALAAPVQDIAELLAMPDTDDFELAIPSRRDLPKAAESN
jgi:PHD/YefM family antitoxin component YafN of YafNO toxin-antitoxin module